MLADWFIEKRALRAYRHGRHRHALKLAQRIIAKGNDRPTAYEIGALAAEQIDEWTTAERMWRALCDLKPNRYGPITHLIRVLAASGREDQAKALVEGRLKGRPSDERWLRLKFQLLLQTNDRALIDRFIKELADTELQAPHVHLCRIIADKYYSKKDRTLARQWYERALLLDPEEIRSVRRIARLDYVEGDLSTSKVRWELALRLAPKDDFEAQLFLGRIADQEQLWASATKHFNNAQNRDPTHPAPSLALEQIRAKVSQNDMGLIASLLKRDEVSHAKQAEIHVTAGKHKKATRAFKKTLLRTPGDTTLWRRYATFLTRIDGIDAADRFWRDVGKKNPDTVEPLLQRIALTSSISGSADAELLLCQELLKKRPDHLEGTLRYGSCLHRMGRRIDAEKVYSRGVRVHPTSTNIRKALVQSLVGADKLDEALQVAVKGSVINSDGTSGFCRDQARLYSAAERPDKALNILNRALELAPDEAETHSMITDVQIMLGNHDRAYKNVCEARRLDQTNLHIAKQFARVHATRALRRTDESTTINLFRKCLSSRPLPSGTPSAPHLMLVTSSLGPGGAERQTAYTLSGIGKLPTEFNKVELVVRTLSPNNHHDFYLPYVRETGHRVVESTARPRRSMARDLVAKGVASRDAVILIESFSEDISLDMLDLYAEFVDRRPRVVHLWQDYINIIGGFAAVLAGIPKIVLSIRSTRPENRRRLKPYMEGAYRLLLTCDNVGVLSNSSHGARDYEDWLDLEPGIIPVVKNGLDIETLDERSASQSSQAIRDELGIPASAPVLGGVMRFSDEKRPSLWTNVALEACSRRPEIHCLLLGDGPEREELRQQVASSPFADRIRLPGNKNPVEPWISAMQMLFLSSKTEGFPNILLEAQALGVPVATMPVGGAPETLLPGKTGIVLDGTTPNEIFSEIDNAMGNANWMAEASSQARQYIRSTYSVESMARQTIEQYSRIPES